MRTGLRTIGERLPIPTSVAGYGSTYVLYFSEEPPHTTDDLRSHDGERFLQFRRALAQRGVFEPLMNFKRSHIERGSQ